MSAPIAAATPRRCSFTSMAKTFAAPQALATAIENRPMRHTRLRRRFVPRSPRPARYAPRCPADQAASRSRVGMDGESFQMLVSGIMA